MEYIKIVTVNTWKCDGNYPLRMLLLAQQLNKLKPQIIACQECFQSYEGNADTLNFLAEALNMQSCFLPGRLKKRLFEENWVDSYSGLGILSAYPIISTTQFELPVSAEDNDRKIQQALIQLPTNTLSLSNTHLTHLRDVELRIKQVEKLADLAGDNKFADYHIICGDFNAPPDSKEIKIFKQISSAIDCYPAGNGAEPRYSLEEPLRENKMVCVDYIFALPIIGKSEYPQFKESGIVLNIRDETSGLFPSDHFGISTTMVLP